MPEERAGEMYDINGAMAGFYVAHKNTSTICTRHQVSTATGVSKHRHLERSAISLCSVQPTIGTSLYVTVVDELRPQLAAQ